MTTIILLVLLFQSVVNSATWAGYDPNETYTPPATSGTTYYVATNGSDSYDGLSPTFTGGSNGPWATLQHAIGTMKTKGNRLLVVGGTYRNNKLLAWGVNGTALSEADRFVFARYANTAVIIDGSITYDLGSWSVYSGSIWKATLKTLTPSGSVPITGLVINDAYKTYRPKNALGDVTAEGNWYYDSSTKTIYVWTPVSVGDPSDDNVYLINNNSEDPVFEFKDETNPPKYVTISGFTIRGASYHAIKVWGYGSNYARNILIEKNDIQFSGGSAIYVNQVDNITISKNNIRANVMYNWPRGRWNAVCEDINAGGWPGSVGVMMGHGTTINGNIINNNGGEGLVFLQTDNGTNQVHTNIFYDNWSVNLYVDHVVNPSVFNNYSYSTGIDNTDVSDHCTTDAGKNKVKQRLRPEGIETADEAYSSPWNTPHTTGVRIYNNVIVNCRRGLTHNRGVVGSGLKNAIISNNTIVTPNYNPTSISGAYSGIRYMNYDGNNNDNTIIKNNIVYGVNSAVPLIHYLDSGETDYGKITFDNNVYYHSGSSTPFEYKAVAKSFADWKTATNEDAGSINSDPLLVVPADTSSSANFNIQSGSPAKDAGISLSAYYTTDFAGTTRPQGSPWDIGAYEFGKVPLAPQILRIITD